MFPTTFIRVQGILRKSRVHLVFKDEYADLPNPVGAGSAFL